ncbi:unnamed protein product [Cyprideis torosa]|uniref:Uncharacterized protein n=1 Tax=Cyprideis torosa TaxID=163714 RepID=A0A7R8ZYX7_9CRUS|nr:unnamed protein product [Cyprideis torosa]CAG0908996.1 unnamed protein product [Cyprideis torosa]
MNRDDEIETPYDEEQPNSLTSMNRDDEIETPYDEEQPNSLTSMNRDDEIETPYDEEQPNSLTSTSRADEIVPQYDEDLTESTPSLAGSSGVQSSLYREKERDEPLLHPNGRSPPAIKEGVLGRGFAAFLP